MDKRAMMNRMSIFCYVNHVEVAYWLLNAVVCYPLIW